MIIIRWQPSTAGLDEETLKSEIKKSLDFILVHKPQRILIDSSNFNFVIAPELQEWFDNEVFIIYPKANVKRKAFLVTSDIFAQVSLQQHINDAKHQTFESAFFDSEEQAMSWLKQEV
ncbi:hypothetical protein M23134_01637 [Microscilla marina ATCC 23134]|uniref:STAS/SEC14 domain-containing protein n=2 Tax=Microscilla marina TaxID=1027 RepID=A1ZTQ4_MICM2|nr:hypothetical protein M23134_01637 [Microscilla marina ATCC 23134]